MEAHLRDEHGNPIQLTDEHGNPVTLTDEHGNPMQLTGVAFTSSSDHPTTYTTPASTTTTTPSAATYGGSDVSVAPAATTGGEAARVTLGELVLQEGVRDGLEIGGGVDGVGEQYQPVREKEVLPTHGLFGISYGEIQLSRSSSSSSSSEDESQGGEVGLHEGQGGRRNKKGLTEKIKEKLTGGKHKDKDKNKDVQHTATTMTTVTTTTTEEETVTVEHHESDHKKGFMEKIKEKLPGSGHQQPN